MKPVPSRALPTWLGGGGSRRSAAGRSRLTGGWHRLAGPAFALVVITLPATVIACAVVARLVDLSTAVTVAICWVALCVSPLLHEFGHLLTLRCLAPTSRWRADGSWASASITRPTLGPRRDAVVAVAGPVVGALPAALVIVLPGQVEIRSALAIPFTAHLLSLLPGAADGEKLWRRAH